MKTFRIALIQTVAWFFLFVFVLTEYEYDLKCGNTNFNEYMIVAVVTAFKQLQINPKKFLGFNGVRTNGRRP